MAVRGRVQAGDVDGDVSFAESIEEAIELRRAQREDRQTKFLDWAMRVPEPKTGTLDFDRFPFQPEVYEVFGGFYRQAVAVKSAQVGASACTVRAAMYSADVLGQNALYVFPTKGDVYDFVDDRVDGMIRNSDYLHSRIGRDHVNNKGLKRIGLGNVYFRGSNSKSGLQSAAIDLLVLDEYDDLIPKHIPDAERRISGSLNGRIRRIGYPSYPDWGLHALYMETDQRVWLVKCERCDYRGKGADGERLITPRGKGWQPIDFFENIDPDLRAPVCAGCAEPIDVTQGRWVAQNPESRIPGFHISRLIVPTTYADMPDDTRPIDDVIKASRAREDFAIQAFWNKDLGLPYEPKEGRVTLDVLQRARSLDIAWVQQPGYAGENIVTMGVDVATSRALNVRISEHLGDARNRKRALFIGEIEDEPGGGPDAFTKLAEMMDRYQVSLAVIDQEPDGRLARKLAATFPGRAYICFYSMTSKDAIKVDSEQKSVTVQRTLAMDATRKVLSEMRNILPQDLPEDYVAHLRAPVRKLKENSMGEKVAFYESRSPDDYYHAETYDIVAREVLVAEMVAAEAQRDVYSPLDSMMPFQRSPVADLEESGYSAGFEDREAYSSGFDDDGGELEPWES